MYGWRARIGYICPGPYLDSQERDKVLPEGVVWTIATLGVGNLVREEFERAFNMWLSAAETLASREVDIIICGGTPVQLTIGYDKSKEMAKRIQEATGVPTFLQIETSTNALNKLSARKIVMATPFSKEHNEIYKKHLEKLGFEVLNMKGLGIRNNVDITKQPSYASYRLAREAFREAPQADAVWIGCPAWPVLSNVSILEKDLDKPVIAEVATVLWMALTTLGIKGPIKGYGKLLEML